MIGTLTTPSELQKYLAGLAYPAHKHEVVRCALELGADDRVLHVLRRIPDRQYASAIALFGELGHPP